MDEPGQVSRWAFAKIEHDNEQALEKMFNGDSEGSEDDNED